MPEMNQATISVSRSVAMQILEMYKILGASKEIPAEENETRYFVNSFYRIVFLENNYIPNDIPFDVLLACFSKVLIYGKVERKGNNISAMVQALNDWLVHGNAMETLYEMRDVMHPDMKPLQLTERKRTPISEIPTKELQSRLENLKRMSMGFGMDLVKEMIRNYETELRRRNE